MNGGRWTSPYWSSFLPIFFDRVTKIMRKNVNEEIADTGLTSAHTIYLIALNLKDGQTMVELSKFLDYDVANTSRVIKTLMQGGYVYNDRKTPKSRRYKIHLTEMGRNLAERVMNFEDSKMEEYFGNVETEDLLQMRDTLITILRSMDPELDDYISSPFDNPYYTLLHTNPPGDGDRFFISGRAPKEKR
ncbi:MAG: MarR family winged helix-turn-helix transcriptional regulator [Methanomassiliicoccaceae archaeon]|nr:MarR family winged helix-turn-helix transcriptional regulator [Methanomassiliicoccaceae archaeon]